jgi:hypothetical protein
MSYTFKIQHIPLSNTTSHFYLQNKRWFRSNPFYLILYNLVCYVALSEKKSIFWLGFTNTSVFI